MIPEASITAWSLKAPWAESRQVEQDLMISRALVEIFNHDFLGSELRFWGGTALNKLHFPEPLRYSEDIDLVRTSAGPIGPVLDAMREVLEPWLGRANFASSKVAPKLRFRVPSEDDPEAQIRLKVKINITEVEAFDPPVSIPYAVQNQWFTGNAAITSFSPEEILATKLRALLQRDKGRDLFDLDHALDALPDLDIEKVLVIFARYLDRQGQAISQGNRLNKPLTRLYFLNRGVRAHLFFRRFRMSCTPNDSTAPAFLTHFQAVEDPRQEGEVLYPLEEILLLVLCGVISGADGWTSIALYGQKKLELLRRFLPYENGTPSHDQLGILFSRLDMEVFQSCFISWVASLNETLEGVVAADGKTLRRSFDTSSSRAAIHMVSAWACDQKLVLGQRKVDDKSNEITAIPELLELLKIKGAIVAIDAMGCQRKICKNPVIKRRIM